MEKENDKRDIPRSETDLVSFHRPGTGIIAVTDILQVSVEVVSSKNQTEADTTMQTKPVNNN